MDMVDWVQQIFDPVLVAQSLRAQFRRFWEIFFFATAQIRFSFLAVQDSSIGDLVTHSLSDSVRLLISALQ